MNGLCRFLLNDDARRLQKQAAGIPFAFFVYCAAMWPCLASSFWILSCESISAPTETS